jgi:hypothetical protein
MSALASSVSVAKREVLHGLAQALTVLAERIQSQGGAAREVGLLTTQAEELAARSWEIACAKRPDKDAAAYLAEAVKSFIDHARALSERAAREASTSNALAAILHGEAVKLKAAGRELDGVNDLKVIRSCLRPVLDGLTAVPKRLAEMTEIASDVAKLGDMAQAMGARMAQAMAALMQGPQETGRNSGVAAVALYKELRGFANAAGSVASRLVEDERKMQQTIADMYEQTNQLASPEAAAVAQQNATAVGRIHDVIVRAKAELDAPAPEPSKPLRGMIWGSAPGQRR